MENELKEFNKNLFTFNAEIMPKDAEILWECELEDELIAEEEPSYILCYNAAVDKINDDMAFDSRGLQNGDTLEFRLTFTKFYYNDDCEKMKLEEIDKIYEYEMINDALTEHGVYGI